MKNKDLSLYICLFFGIVFAVSTGMLIYFLFKLSNPQWSNTESCGFAIALAGSTTSISIFISILIGNRALENELKMYGKLATRRIIQSIKSCKATIQVLYVKKAIVEKDGFNKEVAIEFLDNIIGQVNRLMSTIFDSRDDWKDILKEEIERVDKLDLEFRETFIKYMENQKELEDVKKELEQTQGDKPKIEGKIKQLESELKKTQEALASKNKQLESISTTWPSGATFSTSSMPGFTTYYSTSTSPSFFSSPLLGYFPCKECGLITIGQCGICNKPLCDNCAGIPLASNLSISSIQRICKECREKNKNSM